MKNFLKSSLVSYAASFFVALVFVFSVQQSQAQNLGTATKEAAKKDVKTEKVSLEKAKDNSEKKAEKTLQSTKEQNVEKSAEVEKTLMKEKKEVESVEKYEVDKKLAEIKKNREEIELRKQNGKLTDKEYKDAISKLDKMEKELKAEGKLKLDSKGGC